MILQPWCLRSKKNYKQVRRQLQEWRIKSRIMLPARLNIFETDGKSRVFDNPQAAAEGLRELIWKSQLVRWTWNLCYSKWSRNWNRKDEKYCINCIYRKPGTNVDTFRDRFEKMDKLKENKTYKMCGDVDIDLLKVSKHKQRSSFLDAI